MIANMKKIPKPSGPDLQGGGGDVSLVNVSNRVAALNVKRVCGAAQRRNHA